MASWMMAALLAATVGVSPDVVIVEFSASWCQPCQQLQPAIDRLSREGWGIRKIDADRERDLVDRFRVQSLPTLVILFHGQEVDRIIGAAQYEQLAQRFSAASRLAQPAPLNSLTQLAANPSQPQRPSQASLPPPKYQPTVRGQSPASMGAFPMLAAANSMASLASGASRELETAADVPHGLLTEQPRTRQLQGLTSADAVARVQAATVRLRVDEANSQAFGTGTIIDTHGDEALVLTCGHILRDLKSDSKLFVELFGQIQLISLPAQLVDFDATDADIGLISFRTPIKLTPVTILPLNEMPQIGQSVFSFGCDRGADPSRRDTKIKRINRYLGASNLEIAGAPVLGRSGGGLFDEHGRLIGVCNAADTEDDEGIYAGPPVVHHQLQKLGLTRLIGGNSQVETPVQLASHGSSSIHPPSPQPTSQTASTTDPLAWPDQNAQLNSQRQGLQLISPTSSPNAPQLSATTTLAQSNGQLICIIRHTNGQDRVVTVNSPSPELLDSIQRQSVDR